MKTSLDNFFILTNPLAWIYFLLCLLWLGIKGFLDFTGLFDWYYVLFKLKYMKPQNKRDLVEVFSKKKTKFFWLKQKAWEQAIKNINKENKL